jgi:hypothetical protein
MASDVPVCAATVNGSTPQAAQPTRHRQATYAPGGGRITFVYDDKLGSLSEFRGIGRLKKVQNVRIDPFCTRIVRKPENSCR